MQVRTNVKANGSAAPAGDGHNRFAMRASINGSLSTTAVSIYAQSNMSIYANAQSASTTFYLARVLPGAAGRTLTITFFDTGDASSAGTLRVVPPADGTVAGSALSSFSNCSYTPPPGNSTGPPWGTWTNTASDCSVGNVSSANGWNGQVVQWRVPIPTGYSCDYTDPTKCWITLSDSFPGASVQDTTTWSASLDGNPVRIVQ